MKELGIRWTIGDVSAHGYEALRLSLWGARKVFGPEPDFVVCVNTVSIGRAQERTGDVPDGVRWTQNTTKLPDFLKSHVDEGMAEGVAWKLSPPRLFPHRYELALDNDCILWEMPDGIRRWLGSADSEQCVIAEDVWRCLGQFDQVCGPGARNSGIRGLPPGFDYEDVLREVIDGVPGIVMASELDEQGLQVAAVSRRREAHVVRVEEVTICSPFPPHLQHLGRCGAHFVGLNAKQLPWSLDGRPATEYLHENWERHREALYENVGIEPMEGHVNRRIGRTAA